MRAPHRGGVVSRPLNWDDRHHVSDRLIPMRSGYNCPQRMGQHPPTALERLHGAAEGCTVRSHLGDPADRGHRGSSCIEGFGYDGS